MGDWNGTLPTITVARARASWFQTIVDALTALTGAWTTYTPTNSGITIGSGGSVVASYRRVGKKLLVRWKFTLGTGFAITAPTFSLPAGMSLAASQAAAVDPVGNVVITDTGTATRVGPLLVATSTTLTLWSLSTTGVVTGISSTVPHTFVAGDVVSCRSLELELA